MLNINTTTTTSSSPHIKYHNLELLSRQPGESTSIISSSSPMMINNNININEQQHKMNQSKKPCILFVRGWCRGPLSYLQKHHLINNDNYNIIEPNYIPTPPWPSGGYWWWDGNFLCMLTVYFVILYQLFKLFMYIFYSPYNGLISTGGYTAIERYIIFFTMPLIVMGLIYGILLMTAVVCRSSLKKGVDSCLEQINNNNVVLIVAFSWGGAVVSELLTKSNLIWPQQLDGHAEKSNDSNGSTSSSIQQQTVTQPAILLIAPTTARASAAGMYKSDTATRVLRQENTDSSLFHVVHSINDKWFCPFPNRWDHSGVTLHLFDDNHTFQKGSSRHAIAQIMINLLQNKTGIKLTPSIDNNYFPKTTTIPSSDSTGNASSQYKRTPSRSLSSTSCGSCNN